MFAAPSAIIEALTKAKETAMTDITEVLRKVHAKLLTENNRWTVIGWLEAEIAALSRAPQAAQAEPVALRLLHEAEELLMIAHHAMLKMRLRDHGSDCSLSHEVRMFALHFSEEGRDGPGELQVRGTGKYTAWRKAFRALASAPFPVAPEPPGWRDALQFYAERSHFVIADDTAWDTVSGEPQNFWCDEAGTATVEDGSVAKIALAGTLLKFEDASSPVAGWQPIETAPKDGTPFLGWVAAERWSAVDGECSSHAHDTSAVDFCWWRADPLVPEGGYFDNGAGQIGDGQAVTHWQPLPAPPAAMAQGGQPGDSDDR